MEILLNSIIIFTDRRLPDSLSFIRYCNISTNIKTLVNAVQVLPRRRCIRKNSIVWFNLPSSPALGLINVGLFLRERVRRLSGMRSFCSWLSIPMDTMEKVAAPVVLVEYTQFYDGCTVSSRSFYIINLSGQGSSRYL